MPLLIANKGWETGDAGGWVLTGGGGSGSATVQATDPRSGSYHLRLVSQSGFGSSGASYTFTGGADLIGFIVSFKPWIKWISGAGGRGMNLQIADFVGNTVQSVSYSADYAQTTVSRVIQAGTTNIIFTVTQTGSGGGTHDIDDMSTTPVTFYFSDALSRASGLIHRYDARAGIYDLEISMGDYTSQLSLPYSSTAKRATAEKKDEQDREPVVNEVAASISRELHMTDTERRRREAAAELSRQLHEQLTKSIISPDELERIRRWFERQKPKH